MSGLIPGVRNAGVILVGLESLPASTQMLVVTSSGVIQAQTIPSGGSLTVSELDGTPSGAATQIVFPNGTVSLVGGVATVSMPFLRIAGESTIEGDVYQRIDQNVAVNAALHVNALEVEGNMTNGGVAVVTTDDARLSDARTPLAHNHAASEINSGTLDITRIPLGTTALTVCVGNDTRLSNARTPIAHNHGNITDAGAIGSTASLPLITTTGGVITTGSFGTAAGTFCQGNDSRLSNARTPTAHTHGNITNAGTIGTTANLPIITGASGVLQVGSFGTTANTFCQGNDARLSDARTPLAHSHTPADITGFAEAVDDEVASLLVPGTNVTLNYDDAANTLTINATGGGSNDASTLTTGTLADARLSANVARRDQANTFVAPNASSVPVASRGAAGQTADILQVQDNTGTKRTWVTSSANRLHVGEYAGQGVIAGTGAALFVGSATAEGDRAGFYLSHQTAASGLGFFYFANGTAYVDNYGNGETIWRSGASFVQLLVMSQTGNQSNAFNATAVGLRVRGAASQTANLQTWENSSSAVLASMSSTGSLACVNVTASGWIDAAHRPFTFAGLPLASASQNKTFVCTDSTLAMNGANYGTTPAGGGANRVKLFSNGTGWLVG